MTRLLPWIALGCVEPSSPPPPDEPFVAEAAGTIELPEGFEVVSGVAHLDSPAHPSRVSVRLTTWAVERCELQGDGQALEVPVDKSFVERGSIWACEGSVCNTTSYPLVAISLDAVGEAIGETISGSLLVFDDLDQPAGLLDFTVTYCGRL